MDKKRYYIELNSERMKKLFSNSILDKSDLFKTHTADLIVDGKNKIIKSKHYAPAELNSFDFVEMNPKPRKKKKTRIETLEIN